MTPIEFKEAVREWVQTAKSQDLWSKAINAAASFGKERTVTAGLQVVRFRAMDVAVDGRKLNVLHTVYTSHSGENRVHVAVDDNEVFCGVETRRAEDELTPEENLRLMKLEGRRSPSVIIVSYKPGEWEEWLEPNVIAQEIRLETQRMIKEEARRERQEELEVLKREKNRPLTTYEREIAARFGIEA